MRGVHVEGHSRNRWTGRTESYIWFPDRINNPHDSLLWEKMASIKLNILRRWDTGTTGVRTCCIKFVQKVVQVQTPGVIADPRVRDHPND